MTVPNKKLIAAVEAYFAELHHVRIGRRDQRPLLPSGTGIPFLARSGMASSWVRHTPQTGKSKSAGNDTQVQVRAWKAASTSIPHPMHQHP